MKYLIIAVISCAVSYLMYALISMSLLPVDWGIDLRILCVFTFLAMFGLASAIAADVR